MVTGDPRIGAAGRRKGEEDLKTSRGRDLWLLFLVLAAWRVSFPVGRLNSWVRTLSDLGRELLDRLMDICDCLDFPVLPSNHVEGNLGDVAIGTPYSCLP